MVNKLFKALTANKLLNNVDIANLDLTEIKGELITKSSGEVIFREGDSANSIYLIVSGEVNLIVNKTLDKAKSVNLKENHFIGNDEFFEDATRTSKAVALKDCYLIKLSEEEIHNLIQQDTIIYENLRELSGDLITGIVTDDNEKKSPFTIENDLDLKLDSQIEGINIDDLSIDDQFTLNEEESNEAFPPFTESSFVKNSKLNIEQPFDENSILDDDILKALEEQDPLESKPSGDPDYSQSLTSEDEAFFNNFGESTETINKFDEQKTTEAAPLKPLSNSASNLINFDFGDKEEILDPLMEDDLEIQNESDSSIDSETIDDIKLETDKKQAKEEILNDLKTQIITRERSKIPEEEERMTAEDLEMINKAAQLVNSNIQLDDVLQSIVDVATNLANSDRGTLYLVDKENNELWSKVLMGDNIKEIRLKIGEGVAGWVAKSKEIVNIEDVKTDSRFQPATDKNTGYETKSMLCFPIKNKEEEVVGVLQLLNSKNGKFSKLDEEFLNGLSIHAALALQNANFVESLLQSERVSSVGKMANFLIQDIKKPVLVSKRYAEHLRGKDLQPEVIQVLDMMLEQLNQVADLVQTTSSYAEGKKILHTLVVSVAETLNDFSSRMEQFVQLKNCAIINSFDIKASIKLDVKEFFQCYSHIIKNACDAMPDGGRITIYADVKNGSVVLKFSDEGLGIPDTIKEKIFEPFTTHGKKEGTGLGLAITKKIVEAHGGKIDVESALGEGATFIITLPRHQK